MYLVHMEQECACFKKSEYNTSNTFKTRQDAYNYANIVVELMNEEFCSRHRFYAQRTDENSFIIRVELNTTDVSGCSTGVSCDVGCNSTDDWNLELTDDAKCGCN